MLIESHFPIIYLFVKSRKTNEYYLTQLYYNKCKKYNLREKTGINNLFQLNIFYSAFNMLKIFKLTACVKKYLRIVSKFFHTIFFTATGQITLGYFDVRI